MAMLILAMGYRPSRYFGALAVGFLLMVFPSLSIGQNPCLRSQAELGFDNLSLAVILAAGDDSAASPARPAYRTPSDTSFWRRPTGALFKSVIFPGWGQFSNHKYQKAAIFFGLETLFMYKSVKYFVQTRDRFDTFQETKTKQDFFAYDAARKSRNKYYWFFAGTVFISMWDAYADAHLKPFEETKNNDDFWGLDPADRPRVSPPALSLALTIHF